MSIQKVNKEAISAMCNISSEASGKLLEGALNILNPVFTDQAKIVNSLSAHCKIPKNEVIQILAVFVEIIQLFLKSCEKEFAARLLELGFTSDFIKTLPLESNRKEVVEVVSNVWRNSFSKLSTLKWRTDISLSSSYLQKKVPRKVPVLVVLTLTLSNGKTFLVEIDAATFHKLRFGISMLIRQFSDVKSNFVNK